jgi:hypothetical protein
VAVTATQSDERRIGRVETVLEYCVLLYKTEPLKSAATSFFTVLAPNVADVIAWAQEQDSEFSIGAFVGASNQDPDPGFVWLVGKDPNDP